MIDNKNSDWYIYWKYDVPNRNTLKSVNYLKLNRYKLVSSESLNNVSELRSKVVNFKLHLIKKLIV